MNDLLKYVMTRKSVFQPEYKEAKPKKHCENSRTVLKLYSPKNGKMITGNPVLHE